MKKICDKCFKEIKDNDSYFKVTTYIIGKIVKEGFMHKSCNDKIEDEKKKMLGTLQNVGSLIPGIFQQMGIEPQKVVNV